MMRVGQNHSQAARELVSYLGQLPGPPAGSVADPLQPPKAGQTPKAPPTPDPDEIPWYKRPVQAVRDLLGPFVVDTGTVRIESDGGGLSVETGDVDVQPNGNGNGDGGITDLLVRIPMPVYVGAGALLLVMLFRK